MDFSGWKKIKEDKNTTTMAHPKGHTMTLANKGIPKIQREQLKRLPIQENSGVKFYDQGSGDIGDSNYNNSANLITNQGKAPTPQSIDPDKAKELSSVLVNSGPSAWDIIKSWVSEPAAQANAEGGKIQHFDQGTDTPIKSPSVDQSGSDLQTSQPLPTATPQQASAQATNQYASQLNAIQQKNAENRAIIDKAHQGWDDFNNSPESQIDAKQYQKNMDLGEKVSSGIGLFLGGFSVPFGGHNFAQDFLMKQIDNNVNAQKENYQHQKNVWGAAHDLFGDNNIADNFARTTALDQLNNQIYKAAFQLGPNAQIKGAGLIQNNNAIKDKLKNESAQILTNKQMQQTPLMQSTPQTQSGQTPGFMDRLIPGFSTAPSANDMANTLANQPKGNFAQNMAAYSNSGQAAENQTRQNQQHAQQQQEEEANIPATIPLPQFQINNKGIQQGIFQGNPPKGMPVPYGAIRPEDVQGATQEIAQTEAANAKLKIIHDQFADLWKHRSNANQALEYLGGLGVNIGGAHLSLPADAKNWSDDSKKYFRAATNIANELGSLLGGSAEERGGALASRLLRQSDTPEDYRNAVKGLDNFILSSPSLQTPILSNKYGKIIRPKLQD